VLLHGSDACVFLLLNGGDVPSGRSLVLIYVDPRPVKKKVARRRRARWGGGRGPTTSPARGLPLFVPDASWGSSGSVSVIVRVKKMVAAPPAVIDDRP
jgi:E3 ubiquitin-protein ligase SIAH1